MRLLFASLLALFLFFAAPLALADTTPTDIIAGCAVAANGTPGGQLFSYGTLSTYLTVNNAVTGTAKSYTSANCGSAQIRSNGGAAMADSLPAPAAGYFQAMNP